MNAGLRILLALAASAATFACRSGERPPSAARPEAAAVPREPGANVPAGRERRPAFLPPDDGRISAHQVQSYVAVRRRALEMAEQGAGAAPTPLQWVTQLSAAETRAAGELGCDIAEYRWVQARIAETSASALPEGAPDILKAVQAAAVEGGARLQRAAAQETRVSGTAPSDGATVAYNRAVLEAFQAELRALENRVRVPPSG